MTAKMIRHASAMLLSFVFALFGFSPPVSALGNTASVSIPFVVYDNDSLIPEGTKFSVQLKAVGNSPLPSSTIFEIYVSGSGIFGPIIFDTPGDYEYTISQSPCNNRKVLSDQTVYTVYVSAIYNDSGQLTAGFSISRGGEKLKPKSVSFNNKMGEPHYDNSGSRKDSSSEHDDSSSKSEKSFINPHTGVLVGVGIPLLFLPFLIIIAITGRHGSTQEDMVHNSDPPDETGSG